MKRFWRFWMATLRLDLDAVCEMSRDAGLYDGFHDWPDGIEGHPWHFIEHTCKRCGKRFCI